MTDQCTAIDDVVAERNRQIAAEGWTPEHDDQHTAGELAMAAACYALSSPGCTHLEKNPRGPGIVSVVNHLWPWSQKWWKPKDRRRDLVRAAALLLAEIERLDRAAARKAAE